MKLKHVVTVIVLLSGSPYLFGAEEEEEPPPINVDPSVRFSKKQLLLLPFYKQIENGNHSEAASMVEMLQNEEIDFNQDCWLKKSNVYRTPLGFAAQHNRSVIIQTLLEKISEINVNQGNRLEETALYTAAQYGSLESVRVLCEASGIDTNIPDKDGLTPLMVAQQSDEPQSQDIAGYLTLQGQKGDAIQPSQELEPQKKSSHGVIQSSALHLAIWNNEEDEVKTLMDITNLNQEHELSQETGYPYTPLGLAAVRGHANILELLLRGNDVDVNQYNQYRDRPLLLACIHRQQECVEILCKQPDIDMDSFDIRTDSPLSVVIKRANETEETDSTYQACLNIVKILIQAGASTVDPNGKPYVEYAQKDSVRQELEQAIEEDKKQKKS